MNSPHIDPQREIQHIRDRTTRAIGQRKTLLPADPAASEPKGRAAHMAKRGAISCSRVAQWSARLVHTQEDGGSNPSPATNTQGAACHGKESAAPLEFRGQIRQGSISAP